MHSGLWEVARNDAAKAGQPPGSMDFGPIFGPVTRTVRRADLAICHFETPVAPRSGPFRNYPRFSVPPQSVRAVRGAGFDACTTASNHSLDQGHTGLVRTLATMDRQRVPHTGTARSARERLSFLTLRAGGVRVVVLAYTYGTNGIPADRDKPWSVNLLDTRVVRADARRAKRSGADAVVVALHWGDEYHHRPSAYQRAIAAAVTRSPDVDLVYGHHAHVVQPVRRVNRTWVAFGLGNLVAQQETDRVGVYEGMIALFDLTVHPSGRVGVRWAGYRPTYISRFDGTDPAMRVYDILSAVHNRRLSSSLRDRMREAADRVARVVGPATVPSR